MIVAPIVMDYMFTGRKDTQYLWNGKKIVRKKWQKKS
jgi:hypothetical protein